MQSAGGCDCSALNNLCHYSERKHHISRIEIVKQSDQALYCAKMNNGSWINSANQVPLTLHFTGLTHLRRILFLDYFFLNQRVYEPLTKTVVPYCHHCVTYGWNYIEICWWYRFMVGMSVALTQALHVIGML